MPRLVKELEALEKKTENPEFWNDQKSAQMVLKEQKLIKIKVDHFNELAEALDDIMVMLELAEEGELLEGFSESIRELDEKLDNFRTETLLSGEFDSNNAIISLHPGAGGTESQDWASMLLRMYTRWAEKKKYKVKTLDLQPGDVAGIKSVTLLIEGINAYGYLKTERGVHRLVRISPFDSSGRRHTSFASLDVMPEVDESVEIEILPEEIRIDTFRSSGAGGQHVNTTDSAIRITHLKTGIVVQCQNERSQHQNKDRAMQILRAKLAELERQKRQDELDALRGVQQSVGFGSQIRSYVMQPYQMVKDLRSDYETSRIDDVLDGEIEPFMEAYLRWQRSESLESQ